MQWWVLAGPTPCWGGSRHPEGRASGRHFRPLCPARCVLLGCVEVGPLRPLSHRDCLPSVVLGSWQGRKADPWDTRDALEGALSGRGGWKAVGRVSGRAWWALSPSSPSVLPCPGLPGPGAGLAELWPGSAPGRKPAKGVKARALPGQALGWGAGRAPAAPLPAVPSVLLSGLPGPGSALAGAATM